MLRADVMAITKCRAVENASSYGPPYGNATTVARANCKSDPSEACGKVIPASPLHIRGVEMTKRGQEAAPSALSIGTLGLESCWLLSDFQKPHEVDPLLPAMRHSCGT
jgi:hypothetical protein